MATKNKKKMNLNTETGVSILPVEDWAEGIASKKPRPQVIQDLLPNKRGEYIAIAGRTGIGKTNLALHLAFCLSTGTPFFGLECRRVKVAFLEFEGDENNIKDRYDKIKLNFPLTKGRLFFGMMPLSNPRHIMKAVLSWAEGCSIIILDPIRYLVSGDYLKPNDVGIFIHQFKRNLALNRMAAIITLPIRKPNTNSLIQPEDVYQMKGATEYADYATSVLLLEKTPYKRSSNKITLYFAKHRIASKELKPINFTFRRKKCIFIAQED